MTSEESQLWNPSLSLSTNPVCLSLSESCNVYYLNEFDCKIDHKISNQCKDNLLLADIHPFVFLWIVKTSHHSLNKLSSFAHGIKALHLSRHQTWEGDLVQFWGWPCSVALPAAQLPMLGERCHWVSSDLQLWKKDMLQAWHKHFEVSLGIVNAWNRIRALTK